VTQGPYRLDTGETLIVVSETADEFRTAVSVLRSLDVSNIVSFHTFSLPEGRCVLLLVKKFGRRRLESVVREELEVITLALSANKSFRHDRKIFEKSILIRISRDVSGRELLCDEHFGIRPRHSTSLHLACLVETVSRNFARSMVVACLNQCSSKARCAFSIGIKGL
jgi:hypothetical protein